MKNIIFLVDAQKGASGGQGNIGAQGPTGPQGNKGQKGAQGEDGEDGSNGNKGSTGSKGAQGPTGPGVSSSSNTQINSLGVGTTASGTAGHIRATNDIIAFYSSDRRLKDVKGVVENALEKVLQLNGVMFDWIAKEGIHENKGHDMGIIAQEVEKFFPEIVVTRANGYKAVRYEKLVAVLIEAIKDLNNKIENK